MDRFIPILAGFGIAAIAIYLTVWIANNCEKRTIRAVWTIAAALLLYPLTLGPACSLLEHEVVNCRQVAAFYGPFFWLEFNAPKQFQDAVSRYVAFLGAEPIYVRLRDTPLMRSYIVADIAFRLEHGHRIFEVDPWLLNMITWNTDIESWEDLGGPGWLRASPEKQSIEVFQSRRVHAQVVQYIDSIRSQRASLARGRNIDFPTMKRAMCGLYSEPNFRPGTVFIANPNDHQLTIGDQYFADINELIGFLRRQPRDSLRAGIFWTERRREPPADYTARLREFCESRDVDLFIRPNYDSVTFQYLPRNWWIVRATDSIYLDPD